MNEQELRALVRDAVERHLGPPSRPSARAVASASLAGASGEGGPQASSPNPHASHDVYITLINVGEACLIEPAVECTHCEYCRSHGH